MIPAARRSERLIRLYFECCNAGDRHGIARCFTPDAIHYFPPGAPAGPRYGGEAIADGWMALIDAVDARWSLESLIVTDDGREAAAEWTLWENAMGRAVRGGEWYRLEPESGRIAEIRVYHAAPVDTTRLVNELIGFDYVGRGYSVRPPARPCRADDAVTSRP